MTNAKHSTKWLKTAVGCVIVALYLIPVYWMAATSLKRTAKSVSGLVFVAAL